MQPKSHAHGDDGGSAPRLTSSEWPLGITRALLSRGRCHQWFAGLKNAAALHPNA